MCIFCTLVFIRAKCVACSPCVYPCRIIKYLFKMCIPPNWHTDWFLELQRLYGAFNGRLVYLSVQGLVCIAESATTTSGMGSGERGKVFVSGFIIVCIGPPLTQRGGGQAISNSS